MDQTLLGNWYAHSKTVHTADNFWACSGSDDKEYYGNVVNGDWFLSQCLSKGLNSLCVCVWGGGGGDDKHASGAYPTNGQLDLSPGIELATP